MVAGPAPSRGWLVHNETSGLLEVTYRSTTKSICHDGFNNYDAEVACKELYGSNIFIEYNAGQAC